MVSAAPGTLILNDEEVEAVKRLAEEFLTNGDAKKSSNLIKGLSRSGTETGRALRSYALNDLATPEGVIKVANEAVEKGIDNKAFKGASDALDDFADKVRSKIENAASGKRTSGFTNRMAEIEGVLQDSFDELTDSRLRKLLQNKEIHRRWRKELLMP